MAATAPTIRLTHKPPHSPGQRELIEYPGSIALLAGGRYGKTEAAIRRVWRAMMKAPGLYFWVGYEWPSASMKKAWWALKMYATRDATARGVDPRDYIRESSHELRLPNGSQLWLRTSDNPASIAGEGPLGIVGDEFTYWSEDVWTRFVVPARADCNAWVMLMGRPNGDNWAAEVWRQAAVWPGWIQRHYTVYDNPTISRAVIEALRAEMGPVAFEQEFMAGILSGKRAYIGYDHWVACQTAAALAWVPGDTRPVVLAVDAAKNDDHMALVGVRHGEWSDDAGGYVPEVCYVQEWTPGPEGHDPGDIRRAILGLREQGMVIAGVAYDPYQWVESARILGRSGVWAVDFDQGRRREDADTQLRRLIRAGCIRHDGGEALASAVRSAAAKEYRDTNTERYSCRIVKGDGKVDVLVALSMAVDVLGKTPR